MSGVKKYVLAIDQSTQGTKAMLFDKNGKMVCRADKPHRQIITRQGWVEHDPEEILENTLQVCRDVVEKSEIDPVEICALGISNQRETTAAWNREDGKPVCNAVVWQCARASEICETHRAEAEQIFRKTGLTLSPFFPASKMQWIMEHVPEAKELAACGKLALGTMDAWLIYNLTEEKCFRTDYSNASRTQLFHIQELRWDPGLLESFHVPAEALPEVCMSDSIFGYTNLGGMLSEKIPICGVMGDSHAALFGQNCRRSGQIKTTYGTGSSVMMNIGDVPLYPASGLVTSLAWGIRGKVSYVLEGNLNYTGAVISWLKDQLCMIQTPAETEQLAQEANPEDKTYFVPAFTGLGAPYWEPKAAGLFSGITRTTGKNEMVKACVECIAYQITDLIREMRKETGLAVRELRVDGGATSNRYLMQFQSNIADLDVEIPDLAELSGMGAAYLAGISTGFYPDDIFDAITYKKYSPDMSETQREEKYLGWKDAVNRSIWR